MNSEGLRALRGTRIFPLGKFVPRSGMARVESPDEKAILVGNSMRAGEGTSPTRNQTACSLEQGALRGAAKPCSLCPCRLSAAGSGAGNAVGDRVRLVGRLVPGRWCVWRLMPGVWFRAKRRRHVVRSGPTERNARGWFLAVGGVGRRGFRSDELQEDKPAKLGITELSHEHREKVRSFPEPRVNSVMEPDNDW